MLDHVERGRFLVQPAREDALPALVGAFDIKLHVSTGQLFQFPRGGGFAGAKPYDSVLEANCLAGLDRYVADDSVALIEHA
jgi:hypothetical protein